MIAMSCVVRESKIQMIHPNGNGHPAASIVPEPSRRQLRARRERIENLASQIVSGMHAATYQPFESTPLRMADMARDAIQQARILIDQTEEVEIEEAQRRGKAAGDARRVEDARAIARQLRTAIRERKGARYL